MINIVGCFYVFLFIKDYNFCLFLWGFFLRDGDMVIICFLSLCFICCVNMFYFDNKEWFDIVGILL